MTADNDVIQKSSATTSSTKEQVIAELKQDVQIGISREELKQQLLLRAIKIGLAFFMAVFLLILACLLTRETPGDLYLVQALVVKILGALLAIGILAASFHRISSNRDD